VEEDRQEEADHERVVRWNLAAMTQKYLKAAEKHWLDLAKERAHLDAECTEDEAEQEATRCQEAMSSVLNATAKKIRICARLKRWWNADITEGRKVVARETSRRNSEGAARAKVKLQKWIQQSKGIMWSDDLQDLRGVDMWRAARGANPRASMSVEAWTDGEVKQANTATEKHQQNVNWS